MMDKQEEAEHKVVSDSEPPDQPATSSRFTRSRTYSLDLYSSPRHSLSLPHARNTAAAKSNTFFHTVSSKLAKVSKGPLRKRYSITPTSKAYSVPVSPVSHRSFRKDSSSATQSSSQDKDSARKLIQNLVTIFSQTRSPVKMESHSASLSPAEEVEDTSPNKACLSLSEASHQSSTPAVGAKIAGGELTEDAPKKETVEDSSTLPYAHSESDDPIPRLSSNSAFYQSDEDTLSSLYTPVGSPLYNRAGSTSQQSPPANSEESISLRSPIANDEGSMFQQSSMCVSNRLCIKAEDLVEEQPCTEDECTEGIHTSNFHLIQYPSKVETAAQLSNDTPFQSNLVYNQPQEHSCTDASVSRRLKSSIHHTQGSPTVKDKPLGEPALMESDTGTLTFAPQPSPTEIANKEKAQYSDGHTAIPSDGSLIEGSVKPVIKTEPRSTGQERALYSTIEPNSTKNPLPVNSTNSLFAEQSMMSSLPSTTPTNEILEACTDTPNLIGVYHAPVTTGSHPIYKVMVDGRFEEAIGSKSDALKVCMVSSDRLSSQETMDEDSDPAAVGVVSADLLTPEEDAFSSIGESESTLSGEESGPPPAQRKRVGKSKKIGEKGRTSKARRLVTKAQQHSRTHKTEGRRTRSGRNLKRRRISSNEEGQSPPPPPKRHHHDNGSQSRPKVEPPKGNMLASILTDIPEVDICPLFAHKTTPISQTTTPTSSNQSSHPKIKMYSATKNSPSQSSFMQPALYDRSTSEQPASKKIGKSGHYKLLMRWEKDLNMGSDAQTAPMLYALEKLSDKLSAPGPWLEKAKTIWAVWRRGVKLEEKKVYLKRAADNRIKFAKQRSGAEGSGSPDESESECGDDTALSPSPSPPPPSEDYDDKRDISSGVGSEQAAIQPLQSAIKHISQPSQPPPLSMLSSQPPHFHAAQPSQSPDTTWPSQPRTQSTHATRATQPPHSHTIQPRQSTHPHSTHPARATQSTHTHSTHAARATQPPHSHIALVLNTASGQHKTTAGATTIATTSKIGVNPLRMPVATIPVLSSQGSGDTASAPLNLLSLQLPIAASISVPANVSKTAKLSESVTQPISAQFPTFGALTLTTSAHKSLPSCSAVTAINQTKPKSKHRSPTKTALSTALPVSNTRRSAPNSLPLRVPTSKQINAAVWSITTQKPMVSKCPARAPSSHTKTVQSGSSHLRSVGSNAKPRKRVGLSSRLSPHTPIASPTFIIPQLDSLQNKHTVTVQSTRQHTQLPKVNAVVTPSGVHRVGQKSTTGPQPKTHPVSGAGIQDSPRVHLSYVPPSMLRHSTHVSSPLEFTTSTDSRSRSRSVSVTSSRRSSASPMGDCRVPSGRFTLPQVKQEPLSLCPSSVEMLQAELPIVPSLNTHVYNTSSSATISHTPHVLSTRSTPSLKPYKSVSARSSRTSSSTRTRSTSAQNTPSQATPTSPLSPSSYYNSDEYKLSIWKKIHELNQMKSAQLVKKTKPRHDEGIQPPSVQRRNSVIKSTSSVSEIWSHSDEPIPMVVQPPIQFSGELESPRRSSISTPGTPKPLTATSPELEHTSTSPTDSDLIKPSLMVNASYIGDFSSMSLWEMEQLYAYNKAALYKQKKVTKMIKAQLVKMQQEQRVNQNPKLSPADLYKRFLRFVVEPNCTPDFDLSLGRAPDMNILEDRCDRPVLKKEFDKYGTRNSATGKA